MQLTSKALVELAPGLGPIEGRARLTHLNIRATRIGDAAALALGAAGARLSRLNASCTPLTDAGLEAISADLGDISAHLDVLDLCYCKKVSAAAVMRLTRRQPTLTMLGIGGFSEMNSPKLAEILRASPHRPPWDRRM